MRIRGHPLHPILGVAPLALLSASVALDLGALVSGSHTGREAARWCLGAGALCGTVVAIPGIADALVYPPGARRIPIRHGILNGLVVALMALDWWVRQTQAAWLGLGLSAAALGAAGWALRVGRRLTSVTQD